MSESGSRVTFEVLQKKHEFGKGAEKQRRGKRRQKFTNLDNLGPAFVFIALELFPYESVHLVGGSYRTNLKSAAASAARKQKQAHLLDID
jgi:hypothetical protein